MPETPMISFEDIPVDVTEKWQGIADLIAEIISVPAALIMKVEKEYMEVFVSSKTEGNPYHPGDKEKWYGLYCETVIKTQKELLVTDATTDPHWNKNPDIARGMIAYLGYPIHFPDKRPFGTLCVLDKKENRFTSTHKQLLRRLRDTIEMDIALLQKDALRNRTESRLKKIEWMLSPESAGGRTDTADYPGPDYGDLTELNHNGIILKSMGRELLRSVAEDYLGLLGTSSAIYEKNGDYAFGIFSSRWCRMMDRSSRKLCNTPDNKQALHSGRWLCHESCWTHCSRIAIAECRPVDIACKGGIRMYCEPIMAGDNVVGAINFGYGDPPKDPAKLQKLADTYHIEYDDLVAQAHAYESRPPFIIDMAKKRLHATARLIGSIVEKKVADETLRESETRFQKMLAAVPDMISIHDTDMNIVYSNWNGFAAVDAKKRILGTKCYRTYRGFDDICPDCRVKQVLKTKEPFQEKVKLPDDSWFNIRAFPLLDTHGEPYLFVEWVQDITYLKMAEETIATEKERLSVTLQSIGDGVITTDTNGDIGLLNKAAEEMTGWSSAEAAGRPLTEVFTIINEITREKCENPVARVLANGRIEELANHTALQTRDNREIVIADSAAPIKNANDEIIGVVMVFRDMTEKKKMEKALEVSSKLESLGVLAGGIAHDFNNLLGGIYGYIDMAADTPTIDDTLSRYLSKAMNTIDRARALTGQLLTFAKGGAPIQKIAPLFPFVQETAEFALSGSKVSCEFDVQEDLWDCNYDRYQVGQVIDNLIINAQQAMPLGGTIAVSARNSTLAEKEHPLLAKGDYVRISIKDSGVGIPKELLTRIFDPFFTTKTKGHGLGLATCYSIIKRHDGCINVYSEQGKGSVFHVYLPAAEQRVSDTEEKTVTQHKGSGTVLVMDDEEVMRETISDMLSSFGYTVVCKNDGKEACDYFAAEVKSGRVLSGMFFDLTVPGGMDGKDAVAQIRKLNAEIPVFVTSGYTDDPVMKNPAEYGFTASICKPFRRAELSEMLEQHMK